MILRVWFSGRTHASQAVQIPLRIILMYTVSEGDHFRIVPDEPVRLRYRVSQKCTNDFGRPDQFELIPVRRPRTCPGLPTSKPTLNTRLTDIFNFPKPYSASAGLTCSWWRGLPVSPVRFTGLPTIDDRRKNKPEDSPTLRVRYQESFDTAVLKGRNEARFNRRTPIEISLTRIGRRHQRFPPNKHTSL